MPQPPIATNIHQALDIGRHLTPQITLDFILVLDLLTDPGELLISKIVTPDTGVDLNLPQNLLRSAPSDSVDIGQGDDYSLVSGQIHPSYSGQWILLLKPPRLSTLALFMLGILTDHPDNPAPLDQFAFIANLLY